MRQKRGARQSFFEDRIAVRNRQFLAQQIVIAAVAQFCARRQMIHADIHSGPLRFQMHGEFGAAAGDQVNAMKRSRGSIARFPNQLGVRAGVFERVQQPRGEVIGSHRRTRSAK